MSLGPIEWITFVLTTRSEQRATLSQGLLADGSLWELESWGGRGDMKLGQESGPLCVCERNLQVQVRQQRLGPSSLSGVLCGQKSDFGFLSSVPGPRETFVEVNLAQRLVLLGKFLSLRAPHPPLPSGSQPKSHDPTGAVERPFHKGYLRPSENTKVTLGFITVAK